METRNITLCVPRELLRRIKRIAADRDTSVSAMMVRALEQLADEESRYTSARKQMLNAIRNARSLGTGGQAPSAREALHER